MPLNEQKKDLCMAERLEIALNRLERMIVSNAVYNVEEAASLLHTRREQIYAYIRSGRLPAFHLERNGKWLTTGRDIEALIETLKRESRVMHD